MPRTWTDDELAGIERILDDLPAINRKRTTPELVKHLRPKIRAKLDEGGYTIEQLAEALRTAGYEIPLSTLRQYSRKLGSPTNAPGRPPQSPRKGAKTPAERDLNDA